MPIHDWTRVLAGTFHGFHTLWLGRLVGALNAGLLPEGYYALPEQIATRMQTGVLTLQRLPASPSAAHGPGGVAIAEAPPQARMRLRPDPQRRPRRTRRRPKTAVVRHV